MDWRARLRVELPVKTGHAGRDAEILDELAQHCADRFDEFRRKGVPAADAERRVLDEVRETARRAGHRDWTAAADPAGNRPGWRPGLSRLRQDLRYAARMLRRSPGFATAACLTLALTIGAVTAVFSVVHGVLLAPLPYPTPDRLVLVWEVSPTGNDHNVVSSGNYLDWRDRARSFDALGATTGTQSMALTGDGPARRVRAVGVTPEVLAALAVTPERGSLFSTRDETPQSARVVLVTHAFWQTVLGGTADVTGRTLTLDGVPYRVLGVLPPTAMTLPAPNAEIVVPIRWDATDREERRSHNFRVVGRLKPGVTLAAAQAEMQSLVTSLTTDHPRDLTNWGVSVVRAHGDRVRSVRPMLAVLMSVVVVVLLIACANLANLQLARASGRSSELAVRAALGAGRGRLFAQLLTESLLVAFVGGLCGVALVALLMKTLLAAAPADIPFLESVAINWRVLGFAAGTTITSAVLVGLIPALQASRPDFRPWLHGARLQGSSTGSRLRLRLLTAQVALALVLLVGAALLVRSFGRLASVAPGFDPHDLLTVELDLPAARYPSRTAQVNFYDGLFERLRAIPAVTSVGGTTAFPAEGAGMTFSFAIEGRPSSNPTGREDPQPLQGVSPGYFETMRIPVLRGRVFTEADRADQPPVVVINEALARLHWPGENPVGRRLCFRPGQLPWLEVVGVVGDTHDEGLDQPAPPTVYVPYAQKAETWGWMSWQTVLIRTTAEPSSVLPSVREAIWQRDASLPLLTVQTMDAALAEGEAQRRFAMQLLVSFAALALLLGGVGVYGVLSCGVSERRQEIGIRLALGARAAQVATAVMRSVLLWTSVGVACGIGVALFSAHLLDALLFQIPPTDPVAFASMAALLLVVAAVAAWVPVRRALRLDPLKVLREG